MILVVEKTKGQWRMKLVEKLESVKPKTSALKI